MNHLPQDRNGYVDPSKIVSSILSNNAMNPTDNITKFTEEHAAQAGTPNQFQPFINSDKSRDIASDMQFKDDSQGDETGQHDQVCID